MHTCARERVPKNPPIAAAAIVSHSSTRNYDVYFSLIFTSNLDSLALSRNPNSATMSAKDATSSKDEVTMVDVLQEEEDLEQDAKAVLGGSDDQHCTYSVVRHLQFLLNMRNNLRNFRDTCPGRRCTYARRA